jgi:hypothetical protein
MGRIFDEEDFRRRLEQAEDIPVKDEVRLIFDGADALAARKAMDDAKTNALRKARKKMIRAIREEDDRRRYNGLVPSEVEEIVTGSHDELVKL